MAILIKNNTLFIHIAKSGGTSVTKWIKNNLKNTDFIEVGDKHSTIHEIDKEYKTHFCIIRNPYDRFYSWYNYCLMLAKTKKSINKSKEYRSLFLSYEQNDGIISFVKDIDNAFSFKRSRPIQLCQSDYITLDTIKFKLENLDNEQHNLQSLLGITQNIPHANRSYKTPYINYVNAFIKEYYAKDFKNLEYET